MIATRQSSALKAWEELGREGISIRVIDLYTVKPLDREGLLTARARPAAG